MRSLDGRSHLDPNVSIGQSACPQTFQTGAKTISAFSHCVTLTLVCSR